MAIIESSVTIRLTEDEVKQAIVEYLNYTYEVEIKSKTMPLWRVEDVVLDCRLSYKDQYSCPYAEFSEAKIYKAIK